MVLLFLLFLNLPPSISLQFGFNSVALTEWFALSIVFVAVVTVVYVFVLSKSPPPEGPTISKLEHSEVIAEVARDPTPVLAQAEIALQNRNVSLAIENSAQTVGLCLSELYRMALGHPPPPSMGMSDLAYVVQSRARSSTPIAEPVYQLNNLRLKIVQNQPVDYEQAKWAVSLAAWLTQAVHTNQINF